MITLAFYRAEFGGWQDKLIARVTAGPYSHVELLLEAPQAGATRCVSASGRDGGVREKLIDLNSGKWDLVEYDGQNQAAVAAFCLSQVGKPYDLIGALWSPFAPSILARSNDRWFCSELVAQAMGLYLPATVHPNELQRLGRKSDLWRAK